MPSLAQAELALVLYMATAVIVVAIMILAITGIARIAHWVYRLYRHFHYEQYPISIKRSANGSVRTVRDIENAADRFREHME